MGDDYQLYFLEDQQNKPVAVVLRKDATQELTPALPEVCLASFRACGILANNTLLLLLPMLPLLLANAFE